MNKQAREIKKLIQNIENIKINKFNKIQSFIKLEDYLDVYPDKKLDSSLYKIFGYDDEDIFELDYQFMIENIY